jgi:hypothetical protein
MHSDEDERRSASGELEPIELEHILTKMRFGQATPIISHAAMYEQALFGHEAFTRYYAQQIHYPYPDVPDLPDVAQLANYDRYANQKKDVDCNRFYLRCLKKHILKEHAHRRAEAAGVDPKQLAAADAQFDSYDSPDSLGVSAFAALPGYPDPKELAAADAQSGDLSVSALADLLGYARFDQDYTSPLSVLARQPISVYLTISITTFLEAALRKVGKKPVTLMCRWKEEDIDWLPQHLWKIPDDYRPSKDCPLVYHLCGLDADPQTEGKLPLPEFLALTEDDHLQMLVNLAQDRGNNSGDRLPALVRKALSQDVVLLGFALDSWAFRALYYGLIRETGKGRDPRGVCCIQLPPDQREKQEKYLQGFLKDEAHFVIFWRDLREFAQKLAGPSKYKPGSVR